MQKLYDGTDCITAPVIRDLDHKSQAEVTGHAQAKYASRQPELSR